MNKKPTRKSQRHEARVTELDLEEIAQAELFLFRLAQGLVWDKEIKLLKNREPLDPKHPLAIKAAYWNEETNLIWISGRQPAPDLIALPRHSRVAYLFIRGLHIHKNNHMPIDELIATAQRRVYIFGGRPTYKKAVLGCSCRRPIGLEQKYADLPLFRTEIQVDSYKFCAADYFGPLMVYPNPRSTRGHKVWVLLITCLVTRHVNAEVVENCTTDAFIRALRRHISTYGHFIKIYTDNGLYFVQGEDQLKSWLKSLNWSSIDTHLTNSQPGCVWHFWTSRGSSKAGCIEKMVGVYKACLKRAFVKTTSYEMKTKYTFEEFQTVIKECTALVNHRPISYYVHVDDREPQNTEIFITPSMMVIGRNIEILPPDFRFQRASEFRKVIRGIGKCKEINKVYRARQQAIETFWTFFEQQYMEKLKLPPKYFKQLEHDIPIGQFVLLREPSLKKHKLHPCVVVGVNRRPDGLINSLKVKCTEYVDPVTRDIRDFALMEADYHKLTGDGVHRVVDHDLASQHLHRTYNLPLDHPHRTGVLLDSYSLNLIKLHDDGIVSEEIPQ